jgi:hypothetical protein
MAPCRCANRGYVRALEEDDFGFPDKVDTLAELSEAILGRCPHCGGARSRRCLLNPEESLGRLAAEALRESVGVSGRVQRRMYPRVDF